MLAERRALYQEILLEAKEADLDEAVRQLCRLLGVCRYHPYDSRRSMPGFPDLVLWRDRLMFRELKSERGRCSKEQLHVGDTLVRAGMNWAIWRPRDWRSGRIEKELRAL